MFVPNPIAFELFALEVRWYGILIALGMVLGSLLLYKRAPKHKLDPEKMLDLIIVGIPLGIIGARLYYVLFNLPLYLNSNGNIDILKVLNIRTGGLAVHGGLILAFIGVALLCRHYSYHPIDVLDLAVPGVALAQAIGRWGTFLIQRPMVDQLIYLGVYSLMDKWSILHSSMNPCGALAYAYSWSASIIEENLWGKHSYYIQACIL